MLHIFLSFIPGVEHSSSPPVMDELISHGKHRVSLVVVLFQRESVSGGTYCCLPHLSQVTGHSCSSKHCFC